MNSLLAARSLAWNLTEYRSDGGLGRIFNITEYPFQVGRQANLHICLPLSNISRIHAEIIQSGHSLLLRDLKSTNGSFVNGKRIEQPVTLSDGDLIQFGNSAFRIGAQESASHEGTVESGPAEWAQSLLAFDTLMSERSVVPHFQPIVTIDDGITIGYELLARSNVAGLETPAKMFSTAERLGQQEALSTLMREEGVCTLAKMTRRPMLFVNTDPAEVVTTRLIESLRVLRAMAPEQPLTIEIHEAAVTQTAAMRELKAFLDDHNMRLAYDDFGAGQARLSELTDVPPHCVKFDIKLIRNLDTAPKHRVKMVATLVQMVCDMGITPLAEGVETEAEAQVCRQMQFDLAQGYFFGRPARLESIMG